MLLRFALDGPAICVAAASSGCGFVLSTKEVAAMTRVETVAVLAGAKFPWPQIRYSPGPKVLLSIVFGVLLVNAVAFTAKSADVSYSPIFPEAAAANAPRIGAFRLYFMGYLTFEKPVRAGLLAVYPVLTPPSASTDAIAEFTAPLSPSKNGP